MKTWILVSLVILTNCGHRQQAAIGTNRDAGAKPAPIDHLAPGELGQSKLLAFGFPIPQGMVVERRFSNSVYLAGSVSPSALLDYVRTHAITGPAERIGNRRVFSKVKIRGGDSSRVYDIELDDSGTLQKLVVTDVTPPPLEPGLTEEERWRKAGYKPDGTPLPSEQGN